MKLPSAKYIRIFSDIHLDFDVPTKFFTLDMLWTPEILETDKETVLVIAGDIWHAVKPFKYFGHSWIEKIAKQFKYVIFVLGNHDLWNGNMPNTYNVFKDNIKEQNLNNVFLLQNDTLLIGDEKFVGGTLWTDFLNGNPQCMSLAQSGLMKDYKYIRYGKSFSKIKAKHLLEEHFNTKNYIFNNTKKDYPEQKVWVITHHGPSYKSMEFHYNNLDLKYENALYYSNLDADIEQSEINYWVHGHSHYAKDYVIGNTNILTNPRGYPKEESGYNPWFLKLL